MKKLQLVVPAVLAVLALAVGLHADPLDAPGYTVESAPTPYSTSHGVAQSRPGAPEGHADTF